MQSFDIKDQLFQQQHNYILIITTKYSFNDYSVQFNEIKSQPNFSSHNFIIIIIIITKFD